MKGEDAAGGRKAVHDEAYIVKPVLTNLELNLKITVFQIE